MDEKIYMQDLIQLLAEKSEIPLNESEAFVKAVFDLIEEGLEADRIVKIKGLGTFKLIGVESRESINVNTGERILIDSHTKISFVPDQQMRELINKPFSHFETVLLNEGVTFDDMPVTSMEEEREDAEESTDFIGGQVVNEPISDVAHVDAKYTETESFEDCTSVLQETTAEIDEYPSEVLQTNESIREFPESSGKDTQTKAGTPEQQPTFEDAEVVVNKHATPNQLMMDSDKSVETASETDSVPDLNERGIHKPKTEIEKRSYLIRYLGISAAVMLMGVIGGIIFYFYRQNHTLLNMDNVAPVSTTPIVATTEKEEMPAEADSLPAKKDTLLAKPAILPGSQTDTTRTIITGVRKGRESVIADSTSYRIVGTMTAYKLKAGETLTQVSRMFYETKDLWPYLVMHNRDVISNPNNVPVGTVLRIPALRDK